MNHKRRYCRCPRSPWGLWARQAVDLWTEHHTWQAGYKWKIKKYVLDLEKMNFVICCKKGYGGFVDGNDGNSTKQWSLHIASYYCNKNFCYIGRICSGNFLYWFESMHHKGYKRIQMHLITEKTIARVAEIFYTCIEWTIWLETQLGIFIGVKTTGQVKWKN